MQVGKHDFLFVLPSSGGGAVVLAVNTIIVLEGDIVSLDVGVTVVTLKLHISASSSTTTFTTYYNYYFTYANKVSPTWVWTLTNICRVTLEIQLLHHVC